MAGNSKNMAMDKATAENFYSNFWKRHQYNSIEFKDLLMGILRIFMCSTNSLYLKS